MTKIYLVRHGHVHNPYEILYGRLPRFRLSEHGWQQARRTAELLDGEALEAIYCSPRLRARQTAQALLERQHRSTIHVSQLLDEVRTSWQGSDSNALGRDFNFYDPKHGPTDETIDDIYRRMSRLIESLRRRHAGKSVACVSHGDPIIIASTGLSGLPLVFSNLRHAGYPAPGSLTILSFHSGERPEIRYIDPHDS